jgi:hypothetical protein
MLSLLHSLRPPYDNNSFLILPGEQRAIGELLVLSLGDTQSGPRVMGYAEFARKFSEDDWFRGWFKNIESGFEHVLEGTPRRTFDIHNALIDLIEVLDSDGIYTPKNQQKHLKFKG